MRNATGYEHHAARDDVGAHDGSCHPGYQYT